MRKKRNFKDVRKLHSGRLWATETSAMGSNRRRPEATTIYDVSTVPTNEKGLPIDTGRLVATRILNEFPTIAILAGKTLSLRLAILEMASV